MSLTHPIIISFPSLASSCCWHQYVGGNGKIRVGANPDNSTLFAANCSAACGSTGCNPSTFECCPAACLGGCSTSNGSGGGSRDRCNACAEGLLQAPDGDCQTECPEGTLKYGFTIRNVDTWTLVEGQGACDKRASPGTPGGGGWGRTDARRYCVAACPDRTFESGGECVAHCPGRATADSNNTCPPGPTGTVCDVHLDFGESETPSNDEEAAYEYYEGDAGDALAMYDDDQADVAADLFMKNSYGFAYSEVQSLCHVELLQGLDCAILHGGVNLNKLSAEIAQDDMLAAFGSVSVEGNNPLPPENLLEDTDGLLRPVERGTKQPIRDLLVR